MPHSATCGDSAAALPWRRAHPSQAHPRELRRLREHSFGQWAATHLPGYPVCCGWCSNRGWTKPPRSLAWAKCGCPQGGGCPGILGKEGWWQNPFSKYWLRSLFWAWVVPLGSGREGTGRLSTAGTHRAKLPAELGMGILALHSGQQPLPSRPAWEASGAYDWCRGAYSGAEQAGGAPSWAPRALSGAGLGPSPQNTRFTMTGKCSGAFCRV